MEKEKIKGGSYLIADPSVSLPVLKDKLKQALEGGIAMIQIWDHWPAMADQVKIAESILEIAAPYKVPVLANNQWGLLKRTALHGVHFDKPRENYADIVKQVGRPFIAGITCSNDLGPLHWAIENKLDYVSFCSMFPSATVDSCDIVTMQTVREAKKLTDMPIFVAGGISLENLPAFHETAIDGIALVSAIMKAEEPKSVTMAYNAVFEQLKKNYAQHIDK